MALSYHSSLIARLMCYITSMMKHTKQLMISMNQWDMLNTAAMERHKMAVRPRTVGKHRGLSIFTNNTLPPISISAAYRVQSSTSSLLHVSRVYRESTNTVANRGITDYYPVPSPTPTLRILATMCKTIHDSYTDEGCQQHGHVQEEPCYWHRAIVRLGIPILSGDERVQWYSQKCFEERDEDYERRTGMCGECWRREEQRRGFRSSRSSKSSSSKGRAW
jgi:hypothetical protein